MQPARILLLLCCLTFTGASAQHLKLFRAIVTFADGHIPSGILYEVTDSTLQLAPNNTVDAITRIRTNNLPVLNEIKGRNIVHISIYRKGYFLRGLAWGSSASIATGVILVKITPEPKSPGNSIIQLLAIVTISLSGIVVGPLISTIPHLNVHVNRNPTLFQEVGPKLRPFSVRGQQP